MDSLKVFWSNRFGKVILIISFILVIFNTYCAWGIPIDDAYTTYRYAKNLLNGYGPVYNPGDRVEGYSNFLWMLINAIAIKLEIDPLVFSSALSVVMLLITIFFLLKIYHIEKINEKNDSSYLLFGLIPIVTSLSIYFYITSGLETQMFITIFFLSVFSIRYLKWNFITTGLLFGGLILTRSDGFVYVGIILLSTLIISFLRKENRRDIILSGFIAIVIFILYFTWRVWYYRSLLPNPYYAKTSFGILQLKDGIIYFITFLKENLIWIFLLIFGFYRKEELYLLLIFIGVVFYVTIIGGDWMPHHRFYQILIPLFGYVIGWGVYYLCKEYGKYRRFIYTFLLFVLLFNLFDIVNEYSVEKIVTGRNMDTDAVETTKRVGIYINDNCPKDEKVAFSGAGILPYYADRYVIDTMGINDYHIAHLPGGIERGDPDYVLSLKPYYIVLFHDTIDEHGNVSSFTWEGGRAIYEHPGFKERYVFEKAFPTRGVKKGRYFHLYRRKM